MDIEKTAKENLLQTRKILEETQVISRWEGIGAKVHLIGSLKTGLLGKNRDIDLHIYTEKLDITESFHVMEQLAQHPCIHEISYRNLIHTEEECIEWHAWYEDSLKKRCKLDMIHIRQGSKYDGVVERVTDAMIRKLTPESRRVILEIKFAIPEGMSVPGIKIYRAVLSDGIRNYQEFMEWYQNPPIDNDLDWMP